MQSPSKKFRIRMLLFYAAAGSLMWSSYIAFFASVPPKRQYLGDYGFNYAWTMIVLGGAIVGSIAYLITYFGARRS